MAGAGTGRYSHASRALRVPAGPACRLALDPRGPPALGRVEAGRAVALPPARARHLMSQLAGDGDPLGVGGYRLAQWWSGGEQVTDLFNRFVEAESLAGAVVEFGGDCVQIGL